MGILAKLFGGGHTSGRGRDCKRLWDSLNQERRKFLDEVLPHIEGATRKTLNRAHTAASAFKIVHVSSLCHSSGWVKDPEMHTFAPELFKQVADGDQQHLRFFVDKYTDIKKQPMEKWTFYLSYDIVVCFTGDEPGAMLKGPMIEPFSVKFLQRNHVITQQFFQSARGQ